MTEATIKISPNIPPDLYERLKAQAEANRRSINAELATILEAALTKR